jgi:hypothetical protein
VLPVQATIHQFHSETVEKAPRGAVACSDSDYATSGQVLQGGQQRAETALPGLGRARLRPVPPTINAAKKE